MLPQETTPIPTTEKYGTMGPIPDDLVPMEELEEFEIADGEPDPRGWDLIGSDDSRIGLLDELLVSPTTMTAYFAIVEGGSWIGNRRILVPLSEIQFLEREEKAYTRRHRGDFLDAPVYVPGETSHFGPYRDYWEKIPRTGEFYVPE